MNPPEPAVPIIVMPIDAEGVAHALVFARDLRRAGIACTVDPVKGKFGKRLERASKAGVYYVAILGSDEIAADKVTLRDFDEKLSETLPRAEAIAKLSAALLTDDQRRTVAQRQAVVALEAEP